MSDGREFASEEERWEALRGEGVEAAAPDDWEPCLLYTSLRLRLRGAGRRRRGVRRRAGAAVEIHGAMRAARAGVRRGRDRAPAYAGGR